MTTSVSVQVKVKVKMKMEMSANYSEVNGERNGTQLPIFTRKGCQ